MEKIEIIKEMFEECAIPKPKLSITQTFENGDEYYEDENYIGWNGACVEKCNSAQIKAPEMSKISSRRITR